MKKITLTLAAFMAVITMNAQSVLFEDSFENYDVFTIENVGDWTLLDLDESPTYGFNGATFENSGGAFAFIVFNSLATTPPLEPSEDSNWQARTGEKSMTSFAAVPPPNGNGPNDDWLISPQVSLESENNLLTFYAKATTSDFSNEIFDIAISTTDTDPASFTVLQEDLVPTAIEWQEFTVDLDDYAGEDVFIGIHHRANDQFGFQIDDFSVTGGALSVENVNFIGFTYYNEANQLHLNAKSAMSNITIYSILGQEVVSKELNSINETISISSFNTGVYLAQVEIEGQVKTFKFIKK
jgi:hypothetical protein